MSKSKIKPQKSWFPPQLNTFTYNPSPDGKEYNLLILLHGLGIGKHFLQILKHLDKRFVDSIRDSNFLLALLLS